MIATTVEEIEWEKNLLVELRIEVPQPMHENSDYLRALLVASNGKCHSKLKAMDLKFVWEHVENESLLVSHIPITDQRANMLHFNGLTKMVWLTTSQSSEVSPSLDWGAYQCKTLVTNLVIR